MIQELVRPFTEAVFKTKGTSLPQEPIVFDAKARRFLFKTKGTSLPQEPKAFDAKARRFLFEMIASEVGEYVLAETPAERMDAIADIAVYISDATLRQGMELPDPYNMLASSDFDPANFVGDVLVASIEFLRASDKDAQLKQLRRLLAKATTGLEDDLEPYVKLVTDANNTKIGADGLVTMNEQGKVLKPANFVHPDTEGLWEARHGA